MIAKMKVNWRVIVITVIYRDEKNKSDICIGESQTTINQLERDSIEGRVYQVENILNISNLCNVFRW